MFFDFLGGLLMEPIIAALATPDLASNDAEVYLAK